MSNHHPLKDTQTARAYFWRRLYEYGANNLQFTIYYDKVFRKEYLPSRIRYNQFFFYAAAIWFVYTLHQRNWMFTSEDQKDLGQRRYYTIGRPFQNLIARSADQSNLKSHVQKQTYIL